ANVAARSADVTPSIRPVRAGPSPDRDSRSANQIPNTGTSHAMPTSAPAPPASVLNRPGAQPFRSPTRRRIVTPSVTRLGTAISRSTPGRSFAAVVIEVLLAVGQPFSRAAAYASAPRKWRDTYGSSPTTQLSCPGAIEKR